MNINWFPGHMAKTRKQITEDLKLVDVVVEILDARIPISSQNPDIAQITAGKKKMLILNKCDLADERQNKLWVEYFNKKGIIVIEKEKSPLEEDDLMMLALDAGAEDFISEGEIYEITTEPSDFTYVCEKLEESDVPFLEAEVQMVPTTTVALDEKDSEKMERLIERLEELDDVVNIYHNWEE